MTQMAFENVCLKSFQGCAYGADLGKNFGAMPILLDHLFYACNLPRDSVEAWQVDTMIRMGMGVFYHDNLLYTLWGYIHKHKKELKAFSRLVAINGDLMKKTVLTTAILMTLSTAAMAERQVYSPYPQPTFYDSENTQAAGQAMPEQRYYQPNQRMIYPGREQYGDNFGTIPRHPGDYRDAVDRGTWTGGGVGSRSFDIR